jgi:hypothetical protein
MFSWFPIKGVYYANLHCTPPLHEAVHKSFGLKKNGSNHTLATLSLLGCGTLPLLSKDNYKTDVFLVSDKEVVYYKSAPYPLHELSTKLVEKMVIFTL